MDALQISEDKQEAIFDHLDKQTKPDTASEARQFQRIAYRESARVIVQLQHPDGSECVRVVRTRNISRSGIAFLYDRSMNPGSECGIVLRTLSDEWMRIQSTVVRCRMVSDGAHEVGVRFRELIDVKQFVDSSGQPRDALV